MMSHLFKSLALATPILIAALLLGGFGSGSARPLEQTTQRESWAAFEEALPVLTSPRCLNCHAPADHPTQGDAMLPHNMGVLRGIDGHGSASLHCASCHQVRNIATFHGPPGADDWHMPGTAMPMVWQGLTPTELCRLLTDPERNGRRNTDQVIDHLNTSLVRWAWNPGIGRSIPPLSYEEFVGKMKEWQQKGAACSAP